MRYDERGNEVPATLREYRELCVGIAGENNAAVQLLDEKAAKEPQGLDAEVLASDTQMFKLLAPLLIDPRVNRA